MLGFLFPRKPPLCPPVLVGVHSLPPVLPCGQKKPKTLAWSFSAPAMGISPETPQESSVWRQVRRGVALWQVYHGLPGCRLIRIEDAIAPVGHKNEQ